MKKEGETDEPLERIGYPVNAREELNYNSDIMYKKILEKEKVYETLEKYQNLLNQIEEHYPEFDNLEITGIAIEREGKDQKQVTIEDFERAEFSFGSIEPENDHEDCPSLSLIIAGKTLTYTGSDSHRENETVLEARIMFECFQREKTVSYFELENNGTSAIYYSWEPMSQKHIFGIPLENLGVQTFYFDQSDGVLVPGEKVNFPFTFKSSKDGIFQEKWLLKTVPKVNNGAKICVILHGVAVQNNKYKKVQDAQMKLEYERKRNKYLEGIIYDILGEVKTPPRPSTPIEDTWDDQIKFEMANKNFFFNDEALSKLNSIYSSCKEVSDDEEWNFSLDDLHSTILNSSMKIDKQNQFANFHGILNKIKKPTKLSVKILRTNIMHVYLVKVISTMSFTAEHISSNSKYIQKLYEEKVVSKTDSQKIVKKKSSAISSKEEPVVNENHCKIYFSDQSKDLLYKTTYESLSKAFDIIDQIYSQM